MIEPTSLLRAIDESVETYKTPKIGSVRLTTKDGVGRIEIWSCSDIGWVLMPGVISARTLPLNAGESQLLCDLRVALNYEGKR